MSTDHNMYVGAYILLDGEKDQKPIVDGTQDYFGCKDHHIYHDVTAKFCSECGGPFVECSVPNIIDDCLENVIGERWEDHPLWIAVNNVGYRAWCADEDETLIVVDEPTCSIEVPEINFEDNRTEACWIRTLGPAEAIDWVHNEHERAIETFAKYFDVVKVKYGGIYGCS